MTEDFIVNCIKKILMEPISAYLTESEILFLFFGYPTICMESCDA